MKKLLLIVLAVTILAATLTACSTASTGKTTIRATEAPAVTATPGIEVTTAP